jgi:hypothetical protein
MVLRLLLLLFLLFEGFTRSQARGLHSDCLFVSGKVQMFHAKDCKYYPGSYLESFSLVFLIE